MRQLCSLGYSTTCKHAFKWSSIPVSITGAPQQRQRKKESLQPKREALNSKADAPVMLTGILDHLHASARKLLVRRLSFLMQHTMGETC